MRKKLSTESYKGVRDFYPEEMFVENFIKEITENTAKSFGYVEYGASVLEPLELYEAKSSEEIVNEQTYAFEDRGGRKVSLRPEMTPTIARMIAGKKRELSFPVRWYTSANVFRYEKPQRGRLREHIQFNADIFGDGGFRADAEIITMAYSILKNFGAEDSFFNIRLNDRNVIDALYESFNIKKENRTTLNKILDKKDKISKDVFRDAVSELLGDDTDPFVEAIETPRKALDKIGESHESVKYLISVIEELDRAGVRNVVFTPTLVRGFDYYTGVIFEIFDTDKTNPRALAGGGRYDNILDTFDVERVPAIGFGMGDVTIRDFLETHNLLPEYESPIDAYVCVIGEESRAGAERLTSSLRSEGLNIEMDISNKKIGDQIKVADKKKIPFAIIVGETELKEKLFSIKNLSTKTEEKLPVDKISSYILS